MFKLLLVCFVALVAIIPAFAQPDTCTALGGSYDSTTGVCTFATGLTIEIEYPAEFTPYPAVATVINDFLLAQQTAIVAAAEADGGVSPSYFLNITYDTFSYNSNVRSILFTINEYTGGAHPNLYYRTFTFDLHRGLEIAPQDLFIPASDPLAVIAPIVRADLLTQMGVDADPAWIDSGAAPLWENYQNVVLTNSALRFYFPPYQVAPYAAGPFMVEIPLSQLRAVFRPPYLKG